ncbi:MAG: glycosyltransferase family 2 protein [Acidobacteriota bacterium]
MGSKLSIVLITWNSCRFLDRCCDGIRQQDIPLELIVVDNASSDRSVEAILERIPEASVIRNGSNVGFSAAANQGIQSSSAPFVLLLNPDVFLCSGFAGKLIEAMERKGERTGSATGKLLRGRGVGIEPTKIVDSRGIRMTRNGRHLDIDAGREDSETDASVTEVFGVSGAAALYRREFLRDVAVDGQPFDNAFFAYREDADLSWRGRLFGWNAIYVPSAVAYHVRSVTPERRRTLPDAINFHSVKNRFQLRLKNQGLYLAMRNAPFELGRDLLVLASTLLTERSSLPAWPWLWQHRHDVMRKRREIQRRRTVDDRELARWFTGW